MTTEQIENQANRIADAIVDLVERCDGPVTLSRINREIPGFGTDEATAEKRSGNRLLTPSSVRSTADCFSPV